MWALACILVPSRKESIAQWVECLLSMPQSPGSLSPAASESRCGGTCNPIIQEIEEDNQMFKAIVCYTQFEASLGYMTQGGKRMERREAEEEVVFSFFPFCFLLSVNPSARILLICPLAI